MRSARAKLPVSGTITPLTVSGSPKIPLTGKIGTLGSMRAGCFLQSLEETPAYRPLNVHKPPVGGKIRTVRLLTTWFVAFFAGMRFNLLIKWNVRIAGLWIAMREMPGSAEFAPIYPKFGATFTPTLVSGLLSCCFVVIHDFVRFDTAFGYEIMHSSSVYSTIG